ncbi:MAG TPA: glycosyltransferase [Candidatus Obscuribacterales bacterium]
MPKISVVIPVYNGEKTIKKTIESVLKQTWQDFELIVINDGSQDATLEVLSSIQDPRLRILSYDNAGLASSRNRGIDHAQGEYITFLDADDLWTPDKLEAQFQALEEHPEAAVAYSWTDAIDEFDQFLHPDSRCTLSGNVYPNLLLATFLSNGSNAMIRKTAFKEVGIFDESLKAAEDWEMWIRLAAKYPFVVVPKAQVLYRLSPDSMSTKLIQHERESLKVIERAFAQAPASFQHLKQRSLGNLYKYLTFKALNTNVKPQQAMTVIRLFLKTIKYDSSLLLKGITLKILFVIIVITIFPSQLAQEVLNKIKKMTNTSTLLGYINLNIS